MIGVGLKEVIMLSGMYNISKPKPGFQVCGV